MMVLKLFVLTCFFHLSRQREYTNYKKFEMYTAARVIPAKLAEAMSQYQQNARSMVHDLNEIRFMYEESPHYETGYLMSEIVDSYIPAFSNLEEEVDIEGMRDLERIMKEQERLHRREEKKKRKALKKMRELALAQGQKVNYPPKERNKWWPIDYGWEIDYYW